jgi:hypothetical protein
MTDDYLAAAVGALTDPVITHVTQTDDAGAYLRTHTAEHEALLVQLDKAITSAIGNGGGGGSATGNVLNGKALYRAFLIRTELGSWCRMNGVKVTRDLMVDLIAWFDLFKLTGNDSGFYVRQLNGWAKTIRDLIDPPQRVPQDIPCPVCGATKYTDEEGDISTNPIVLEYHREDPIGTARVVCRNADCAAEWDNMEALNELKDELAEKEQHAAQ